MCVTIGILTIGQSPRDDVVPSMRAIWGEHVPVIQRGALDDMSGEQLESLAPTSDSLLVSRLRDGAEIRLDADRVEELLQDAAGWLVRAGVDLLLVLCTGSSRVRSDSATVIQPRELFPRLVRGLTPGRVGILLPAIEQEMAARDLFGAHCADVITTHASPYAFDGDRTAFADAAAFFRRERVDLIAMNCMGYRADMARFLRREAGVPAIPASVAVAHSVALLVDPQGSAKLEG